MKAMKALLASLLLATLAAVALPATIFAQGDEYPSEPLKIIVPFSAGGGTDVLARKFAQVLQKHYPAPIAIDNVPGGGSAVGLTKLYNSKPNGYTVGIAGTHLLTACLQGFAQFPWDSLTHVAILNTEPYVIAVRGDSRWKTIQDLIEDIKAHPRTITMGNAGAGALTDIVAQAINRRLSVEFAVVPFDGGANERAALLGGHVDAGIFSGSEVAPHAGPEGEVRVLAAVGEDRCPLFPDAPSLGELGYHSIPAGSVRGLAFPPKTPKEIVTAFEGLVIQAVDNIEWKNYMRDNGYVNTFYVCKEMMDYYDKLYENLKETMQEMGLVKQ